jgi:hypothetical protein
MTLLQLSSPFDNTCGIYPKWHCTVHLYSPNDQRDIFERWQMRRCHQHVATPVKHIRDDNTPYRWQLRMKFLRDDNMRRWHRQNYNTPNAIFCHRQMVLILFACGAFILIEYMTRHHLCCHLGWHCHLVSTPTQDRHHLVLLLGFFGIWYCHHLKLSLDNLRRKLPMTIAWASHLLLLSIVIIRVVIRQLDMKTPDDGPLETRLSFF